MRLVVCARSLNPTGGRRLLVWQVVAQEETAPRPRPRRSPIHDVAGRPEPDHGGPL